MKSWPKMTQQAWNPQFVAAADAPKSTSGVVAIRFKVLPNGRLMDGSMVLERRSGDVAMDRAAWGALTSLNYPPLPSAFHGPYLELRAYLPQNTQPGH
jgi:TonB family protein